MLRPQLHCRIPDSFKVLLLQSVTGAVLRYIGEGNVHYAVDGVAVDRSGSGLFAVTQPRFGHGPTPQVSVHCLLPHL